MYAVLKTGGKQYKVAENDVITVERLTGEAGESIDLNEILMIGQGDAATVGTPVVEGAIVSAQVLEHTRGNKITVFKKKRRKNYRRTLGHRQELTVLRITDILEVGQKKSSAKKPTTKAAKPSAKRDSTKIEKSSAKKPTTKAAKPSAKKDSTKTEKSSAKKPTTKAAKPSAKKDSTRTEKPAAKEGKVSKSKETKE